VRDFPSKYCTIVNCSSGGGTRDMVDEILYSANAEAAWDMPKFRPQQKKLHAFSPKNWRKFCFFVLILHSIKAILVIFFTFTQFCVYSDQNHISARPRDTFCLRPGHPGQGTNVQIRPHPLASGHGTDEQFTMVQ
jgi:hypothetical protein